VKNKVARFFVADSVLVTRTFLIVE